MDQADLSAVVTAVTDLATNLLPDEWAAIAFAGLPLLSLLFSFVSWIFCCGGKKKEDADADAAELGAVAADPKLLAKELARINKTLNAQDEIIKRLQARIGDRGGAPAAAYSSRSGMGLPASAPLPPPARAPAPAPAAPCNLKRCATMPAASVSESAEAPRAGTLSAGNSPVPAAKRKPSPLPGGSLGPSNGAAKGGSSSARARQDGSPMGGLKSGSAASARGGGKKPDVTC